VPRLRASGIIPLSSAILVTSPDERIRTMPNVTVALAFLRFISRAVARLDFSMRYFSNFGSQ